VSGQENRFGSDAVHHLPAEQESGDRPDRQQVAHHHQQAVAETERTFFQQAENAGHRARHKRKQEDVRAERKIAGNLKDSLQGSEKTAVRRPDRFQFRDFHVEKQADRQQQAADQQDQLEQRKRRVPPEQHRNRQGKKDSGHLPRRSHLAEPAPADFFRHNRAQQRKPARTHRGVSGRENQRAGHQQQNRQPGQERCGNQHQKPGDGNHDADSAHPLFTGPVGRKGQRKRQHHADQRNQGEQKQNQVIRQAEPGKIGQHKSVIKQQGGNQSDALGNNHNAQRLSNIRRNRHSSGKYRTVPLRHKPRFFQ
jgi:hypothetical protein